MTVLGTTLATMLTMTPGGDVSVIPGPGHDMVTLRLGDQQVAVQLPEDFDAAQFADAPSALTALLQQILADDEPDLIAEPAPTDQAPEAPAAASDEGDVPAELAQPAQEEAVASDTDAADTSDNQAKADEQDSSEPAPALALNDDAEPAPEADETIETADLFRYAVEDRPTEEAGIDDSEVIVEAPESADSDSSESADAAAAPADSDSAVSSTDEPSDQATADAAPTDGEAEATPPGDSAQSNVDEGDAIPDDVDEFFIIPISTFDNHVDRIHHDLRMMVRSLYR